MDVTRGRRLVEEQAGGTLGGCRPGHAEEVDLGLSGLVTGRDVFTYVVKRPFIVWLISGMVLLPVFGILLLMGAASTLDPSEDSSSDPFGTSDSFSSAEDDDDGGGMFALSGLIWFIPPALGFASLLVPVRVGKQEFGFLIDDHHGAADSAFGHTFQALQRRKTPADSVTPRRFSPGIGQPARNYLLVTKGKVEMWVTVSPSGLDLWVGWTAWVRHWPLMMPFTLARQTLNSALLKGGAFHEALRLTEVRAVLDGTHHAVLEGADLAMQGQVIDVRTAFGYDLPIETISPDGSRPTAAPSVPAPTPVPVASSPAASSLDLGPPPDPYGPPPDPTTRHA